MLVLVLNITWMSGGKNIIPFCLWKSDGNFNSNRSNYGDILILFFLKQKWGLLKYIIVKLSETNILLPVASN